MSGMKDATYSSRHHEQTRSAQKSFFAKTKWRCIIIDGSALINALPPRTSKTFDDYAKEDIIPKVESYGARYKRVDVVLMCTRSQVEIRDKVEKRARNQKKSDRTSKTPGNWHNSFVTPATRLSCFTSLRKRCVKQRRQAQSWRDSLSSCTDRSSATTGVDEARLDLFARKQRPYNSIPPTQAALREHAKRAAYQAGIIWGQATISNPDTSSPLNGDGHRKERHGRYVGQHYPLLQRAVGN
ncbi:hypothetical protein OS493_033328 [Desmophyllum pertusum]|uniref:Uncharacterized protein n=1 Tax=Desmophyllum pertusum TaxID=174260 RepID=A0A9W9Z8E6_9CNID|nr:hypothetical protein OS493_033328 [Desmophyllum pertusum]